jgi:hypothetical protein
MIPATIRRTTPATRNFPSTTFLPKMRESGSVGDSEKEEPEVEAEPVSHSNKSVPKKGTRIHRATRAHPITLETACEECVVRALNLLSKKHSLNRPFTIECVWDAHASKLCRGCAINKRICQPVCIREGLVWVLLRFR